MSEGPLISYSNVSIWQQEQEILENISFSINPGEFVYLIGKVGSGKSTFLKSIYGELDIKDGNATVLGYDMKSIKRKHIPALRRRIGIVFQDFQLLTDRTVKENLEFVLKATGWKNNNDIQARITEVLTQVGMETKGYKMPNELSGGEQQRIVIARAILNKPAILPEAPKDGKQYARKDGAWEEVEAGDELSKDAIEQALTGNITTHRHDTTYNYTDFETDVWDGTSISTSLHGSGTKDDPYLIQSCADWLHLYVNGLASYNTQSTSEAPTGFSPVFKLNKNLDFGNKTIPDPNHLVNPANMHTITGKHVGIEKIKKIINDNGKTATVFEVAMALCDKYKEFYPDKELPTYVNGDGSRDENFLEDIYLKYKALADKKLSMKDMTKNGLASGVRSATVIEADVQDREEQTKEKEGVSIDD